MLDGSSARPTDADFSFNSSTVPIAKLSWLLRIDQALPSSLDSIRVSRGRGDSVGYTFEWDRHKAAVNRAKHGVTFNEASTVFGDLLAMLMDDPDHSIGEKRYLLLGMSDRRRLLVVAFADRPPRTRLISARRAERHERKNYEEES